MNFDFAPRGQVYYLDRKATAVALRECKYDIDFEDWDGLSDESVLEIIAVMTNGSEEVMRKVVKEIE